MSHRKKVLGALSVTVGMLLISASLMAHHAALNYDFDTLWMFEGTVTQFDFVNPHIAVHFTVQNPKGIAETWSATGASPNSERRFAWTKNTLKPGDKLTVYGFVQRDGLKTMQMPIIVVNGKVMERQHSTEFRLYTEYKAKHPSKLPKSYAGGEVKAMEPRIS